jgi:hypothetical protein
MRISESQLRRVVISEVENMNTRNASRLIEAYTPGVKAADGSITWQDASAVGGKQWSYSWNPATRVAKTGLVGQPLAVIDPTKKASIYAAIKTQGERAEMEASGRPAPAAAPGSPGCQLPNYRDSLTTALAKTALAGFAAGTVIDLIIFGSFYKLTAAALAAGARAIRSAGSGGGVMGNVLAAARTAASMATGGTAEVMNESMAGLLDGLSSLISGTTAARLKFTRDCNLQNLATGMGAAFSSAISSIVQGVKGGIQSLITFFTQSAGAALQLLQTAGLVALGLTVATFTTILNVIAALVRIGAAAVQSAISSALLAAGAALTAAGGAATRAGTALSESKNGMLRTYKKNVRELAREMNEAATITSIMSRLDESTRKSILSSMIAS